MQVQELVESLGNAFQQRTPLGYLAAGLAFFNFVLLATGNFRRTWIELKSGKHLLEQQKLQLEILKLRQEIRSSGGDLGEIDSLLAEPKKPSPPPSRLEYRILHRLIDGGIASKLFLIFLNFAAACVGLLLYVAALIGVFDTQVEPATKFLGIFILLALGAPFFVFIYRTARAWMTYRRVKAAGG